MTSLQTIPVYLPLAWIGSAMLAGMIAHAKQRSVAGAILAGLAFGLLAVIVLAVFTPSRRELAARGAHRATGESAWSAQRRRHLEQRIAVNAARAQRSS